MANNQGNNIHTLTHSSKSNDENSNENEQSERETMPKSINNGTSSGDATNGHTQVLTLIQQIKQHLPALILTLKNKYANELKDKSIEEQEAYILQNVDSFRDMIVKNIEELKELVLSARPSSNTANEPNHEERKAAYRELLKLGTALMSKMQDTLNKIFDEYIKFLHEVRQVIRADNDPTPILNDFNRNIEVYLKQCWDPLFITAEKRN
ncbi:unnamed protein product [Rotaria sp. Silwood1]|nr:unnamed protein product [Rotaria sp. Silwood1]